MVSQTRERLLLACLLSLTLGVGSARAQFGGPAREGGAFTQPSGDAPSMESSSEDSYLPDDIFGGGETDTGGSYAPEPSTDTSTSAPAAAAAPEPQFRGYTESDFTGPPQGGLEDAYVRPLAAPAYWLPEFHLGCDGCPLCGDPWFVQVEAVMMHRNRARDTVTTTTTQVVNVGQIQPFIFEQPVMNTKAGTFQMEPGVRVTLGRYLGKDYIGRDHTLEFTYMGVTDWNASRFINGSRFGPITLGGIDFEMGELNSPFSPTGSFPGSFASGFSNADYHGYQMHSEMHNFELNWRIRRGERRTALVASPDGSWQEDYTPAVVPSMLLGLRYLNFNDEFTWNSRGVITADGVDEPFSGQYNIDTTNSMLGMQIGGDIRWQWRRLSLSVQAKVGLYGTSSDQNSEILVNDDTTLHSGIYPASNQAFGDDTMGVGFIGELDLMIRYRLSPHCTIRTGYDFNWVTGLALAPDQLTFSNPATVTINHGGDLLLQARLGLEFAW
ncbi:MAG: BBP7 family outer membrane beta-barrel protein [Pirellulales bacterium]